MCAVICRIKVIKEVIKVSNKRWQKSTQHTTPSVVDFCWCWQPCQAPAFVDNRGERVNVFPVSLCHYSVNVCIDAIVQANEVERLVTWYNPLSQSDLLIPGEDDITTWRSHNISEKQYRELARLAWDISPELALFLPDRFATYSRHKFHSQTIVS